MNFEGRQAIFPVRSPWTLTLIINYASSSVKNQEALPLSYAPSIDDSTKMKDISVELSVFASSQNVVKLDEKSLLAVADLQIWTLNQALRRTI